MRHDDGRFLLTMHWRRSPGGGRAAVMVRGPGWDYAWQPGVRGALGNEAGREDSVNRRGHGRGPGVRPVRRQNSLVVVETRMQLLTPANLIRGCRAFAWHRLPSPRSHGTGLALTS